jgi:uncharacterized membrane protein
MSKNILNDLPELLEAQVISEETAQRIRQYYEKKAAPSANRLVIVFGILGALLIGLGIILIIAHNWDNLGKTAKLAIAMVPLLLGQVACAFALFRKRESIAWREASATFLVLAIAASISIVSQVYNIDGSLGEFLWLWMILSIPVVYVMQSSLASLLYITGITWYACEVSYFHYPSDTAWWYWGFLILALPHYYYLLAKRNTSNFFYFHSWMIAISLTITLGMFGDHLEELTILAYLNIFAFFILLGQLEAIKKSRLISNGFLITGSLGTVSLLLWMTFEWYWVEILRGRWPEEAPVADMSAFWISFALPLTLLIVLLRKNPATSLNAKSYVFILGAILFAIGLAAPKAAQISTNLVVLAMAVFTIRDGANQHRLGLLNYGLLILTALIVCRFFDTDISFVIRGLLFVAVGAGFFVANYWMIRKRRTEV